MAKLFRNRAQTPPNADTANTAAWALINIGSAAPRRANNKSVRAEPLEQGVWERVCALLQNPSRVADEYQRRVGEAGDDTVKSDELAQLERQRAALQRGIGRLIDSYAAGVIDRPEFEPRVTGLKARLTQLQERQQAAADAANAERELTLVIGQIEDFAGKIRNSLGSLDWLSARELMRTLVRQIEIDGDQVEVVFRVPPPAGSGGPPWPGPISGKPPARQDCTGDRRTHHRLVEPVPTAEQGLGMPEPKRPGVPPLGVSSTDAATVLPKHGMVLDRLLQHPGQIQGRGGLQGRSGPLSPRRSRPPPAAAAA